MNAQILAMSAGMDMLHAAMFEPEDEQEPEYLSREEREDEDRWEAADRAYDLAREDAI